MSLLPASAASLSLIALLAGCAAADSRPARSSSPEPAASSTASGSPSRSATGAPVAPDEEDGDNTVVGTVVRFASDDAQVDVTIDQDTPAVRDFLSMLPLTIDLEEFIGREKIAHLPRELEFEGSPGSDPEDGDLIYYTQWGNLGFYYNAEGIGYSDTDLHIGIYEAMPEQLDRLQGSGVTVEVAE
jgi:hypothetical protein